MGKIYDRFIEEIGDQHSAALEQIIREATGMIPQSPILRALNEIHVAAAQGLLSNSEISSIEEGILHALDRGVDAVLIYQSVYDDLADSGSLPLQQLVDIESPEPTE